jgi:flagellar motor switch protein FliN/FliY
MDLTPEEMSEPNAGGDDVFMDLQLAASIRFGETEMLLEEAIKLGVGSVIELNSSIDEPVDLVVNGRSLARGEVVVVDGYYGIRITELSSGNNRLVPVDA